MWNQDDPYESYDSYYDSYGSYSYRSRRFNWRESNSIQTVISALKNLDSRIQNLEQKGGNLLSVKLISELLKAPLGLANEPSVLSLSEPAKLRRAISSISYSIHLEIRQRPRSRLPAYYLCRTRDDFWSEYSFIVEDLYMSPGYPIPDSRFARLMDYGKEHYFIRLSQFREKTESILLNGDKDKIRKVDKLLLDVGKHVLSSAWHEDQKLAMMVSETFELPIFRSAIELMYCCLSSELCELRDAVRPSFLLFFSKVYDHPPIKSFLKTLPDLDGGTLNEVPKLAKEQYRHLAAAFGKFLCFEVTWGDQRIPQPLWKLLYSNFSRFDLLNDSLREHPEFKREAKKLEKRSRKIINEMLG